MTQECRHSKEPADCVRCKALAGELLSVADLSEDERARVQKLISKLKHNESIDDESRSFLNDLAVRYLE